MTGDDDGDDGRPDELPVAEALDEVLASDDSGLCAGLLDVLALLSGVGAARWLLHKAGDLGLVAAPGGYGVHEAFAPRAGRPGRRAAGGSRAIRCHRRGPRPVSRPGFRH